MKLSDIPFQAIDWAAIAPTEHRGESGQATWRTVEVGNFRARVVEYSPGYVADHWCERGHVVYVLEGEVVNELRDGRSNVLTVGQGYVVGDPELSSALVAVGRAAPDAEVQRLVDRLT